VVPPDPGQYDGDLVVEEGPMQIGDPILGWG
jgi:hypothetical protein